MFSLLAGLVSLLKFMYPHCGGSEFRLLDSAGDMPAAECLNCGRASTFDQSMLPEPAETVQRPAS
jgi:hypothetical protein